MSAKTALDVLVDFAPGDDTSPIAKEARAELAALREAAEALKPFSHPDLCKTLSGNVQGDASQIFGRDDAVITLGDCRRAAVALAASGVVGGKPRPCPYCGETRNGAHKSWCQFLHQFDHGLDDAAQETK